MCHDRLTDTVRPRLEYVIKHDVRFDLTMLGELPIVALSYWGQKELLNN